MPPERAPRPFPPARSPSPACPSPAGAGPGGEPGLLLEDAAAAVPSTARARPRCESRAGASAEAPGAPSPPHLLWPLRPHRDGGGAVGESVSYQLKITKSERWVSPSLPTTGPERASASCPARLGAGLLAEGRVGWAAPGRRAPNWAHKSSGSRRCRSETGGRAVSGRAAPAVPPAAEVAIGAAL